METNTWKYEKGTFRRWNQCDLLTNWTYDKGEGQRRGGVQVVPFNEAAGAGDGGFKERQDEFSSEHLSQVKMCMQMPRGL